MWISTRKVLVAVNIRSNKELARSAKKKGGGDVLDRALHKLTCRPGAIMLKCSINDIGPLDCFESTMLDEKVKYVYLGRTIRFQIEYQTLFYCEVEPSATTSSFPWFR